MGALAAGTLVAGKYRVRRRIGAGGMGAVYEGEHVEIGKRVAIKVIEHEHARSTELAARFKREARAASAVESEHIVQVFDVGDDPAAGLYMVMEFLSGEDLAERLAKTGGKLPVEEALTILLQAARALAKAHAAGVVHRDLKPANLFLTSREDDSVCVKVLDFGISKLTRPGPDGGSTKTANLTREGSVMGTPMYMSPEQAQGLAVDARTDLWSLGAVLYEVLSGRTAFEERSTYEQMIVQIVTQRPKPLRQVAPWVPDPIAQVVDSTLIHDVAQRLPDAATFARRLVEAAKMPEAPISTRDATMLVDRAPSKSDPHIQVRVQTGPSSDAAALREGPLGPPPTGTGVVVGARTQLDAGIPPKRSPIVWLSAAAALAVVVGVAAVATRSSGPKPAVAAGLVAAPSVAITTAISLPTATPAPSTTSTLQPLETPSPIATMLAPAESASAKPPAPGGRPAARGGQDQGHGRPASTAAAGARPSQYGGAGVSTAY